MDERVEAIRKRLALPMHSLRIELESADLAYLLERLDEALRLLERARTRIVKTGYDAPDIDAFLAHKGESNG